MWRWTKIIRAQAKRGGKKKQSSAKFLLFSDFSRLYKRRFLVQVGENASLHRCYRTGILCNCEKYKKV